MKTYNHKDLSGEIVYWNNERWLADYSDENFKDDDEPTSYFLIPTRYINADEYDKMFAEGLLDSIGYWVYETEITHNAE
jgi:hypothetical protein